MTYKISVTPEAKSDIRQIREYISIELNNEKAASRTVGEIIRRIRQLKTMPEIGAPLSARTAFATDYRYLVCGNYTVFYLIEKNTVRISRVIYGRRNFMSLLFDK